MKKLLLLSTLLVFAWGTCRVVSSLAARADEEGQGEPIGVVTHVDVLPRFTAEGRELLRQFALDARKDPGAVRVEVFEELNRPNHSTIVEVWRNRKSFEDHLGAEPTKAFRARLQPMLGSPFDERLHRQVR